jgi:hypothetical protein
MMTIESRRPPLHRPLDVGKHDLAQQNLGCERHTRSMPRGALINALQPATAVVVVVVANLDSTSIDVEKDGRVDLGRGRNRVRCCGDTRVSRFLPRVTLRPQIPRSSSIAPRYAAYIATSPHRHIATSPHRHIATGRQVSYSASRSPRRNLYPFIQVVDPGSRRFSPNSSWPDCP